jgi:hypothetical protein
MYAVCTFRLAREFGLPFLAPHGEVFALVSLAAGAATAIGPASRLDRRGRESAVAVTTTTSP